MKHSAFYFLTLLLNQTAMPFYLISPFAQCILTHCRVWPRVGIVCLTEYQFSFWETIVFQVQRNFDNFGRFLARRMGIKLKPSSKMTTDLANRAENSGAASNIRGGKAALVDDMEVHISKHGQATGQSGELPGPDSAMKLAHNRDTPANRTLIFSPG